mgnify:CR=1 FL=1
MAQAGLKPIRRVVTGNDGRGKSRVGHAHRLSKQEGIEFAKSVLSVKVE